MEGGGDRSLRGRTGSTGRSGLEREDEGEGGTGWQIMGSRDPLIDLDLDLDSDWDLEWYVLGGPETEATSMIGSGRYSTERTRRRR